MSLDLSRFSFSMMKSLLFLFRVEMSDHALRCSLLFHYLRPNNSLASPSLLIRKQARVGPLHGIWHHRPSLGNENSG